jgi:hypothetical protein
MTEVHVPGVSVGVSDDAIGVEVLGIGVTVGRGGDDGGEVEIEEGE